MVVSTINEEAPVRVTFRSVFALSAAVCLAVVCLVPPVLAQDKPAAPAMSKEQQAMMDAMMKAMVPGENHKLLASLSGNWTFAQKMWMDPPRRQRSQALPATRCRWRALPESTAKGVFSNAAKARA
jgi:hypothetical protein